MPILANSAGWNASGPIVDGQVRAVRRPADPGHARRSSRPIETSAIVYR